MIRSRADKDAQVINICCTTLMKHEIRGTNYLHNPNYMNKAYIKILTRMRMYKSKILQLIGCQFYVKQILTQAEKVETDNVLKLGVLQP